MADFTIHDSLTAPAGSPEQPRIIQKAEKPQTVPGFIPLLDFTGSGKELFFLYLRILLLTVCSLGLYIFWGKTQVRRYLWEHTRLLGESLEYTGTGGELFKSFLLATLLGGGGMLIFSLFGGDSLPGILFLFLFYIPLGYFAGYQALRYRLTRTRWRGIRGNMDGSAIRYALVGTGYSFLSMATLLLASPLETARLTAKRLNAAFFGNRRFVFTGKARRLVPSWLVALGLLVAFGLAVGLPGFFFKDEATQLLFEFFFRNGVFRQEAFLLCVIGASLFVTFCASLTQIPYRAAVMRWLFANLSYGGMRFEASDYTGGRLFRLTLGNGLLLLFTLGLAYPWTEIRSVRFFLSHIRYTGDPDLAALAQDSLAERSGGEGMLDSMDMDFSL